MAYLSQIPYLSHLQQYPYLYLTAAFLAAALGPVLVAYPLLWLLFGRDKEGVIRSTWYGHMLSVIGALAIVVLLRFVYVAVTGEDALFDEVPPSTWVAMNLMLPVVAALLMVRRTRKKAIRQALSRAYVSSSKTASSASSSKVSREGRHTGTAGTAPNGAAASTAGPSEPFFDSRSPPGERDAYEGALEDVDESVLLAIDDEMESGNLDRALWIRAYAETDGVDHRAHALYIRLRAAKLESQRKRGSMQARPDEACREPAPGPD